VKPDEIVEPAAGLERLILKASRRGNFFGFSELRHIAARSIRIAVG
jgi:hypothetical protein